MPQLVQPLPPGPLDIIGDIHGESRALDRLLGRLGVDLDAGTAERPLIFVGDLVDRGPDSPAVVWRVRELVEAGLAWCVAGNHELNLLQGDEKEGNGWAQARLEDHYQARGVEGQKVIVPFDSEMAYPEEVEEILTFFRSLPLALVRDDLRVVHACWDDHAVARIPERADLAWVNRRWTDRIHAELAQSGVFEREIEELRRFGWLKDRDNPPTEDLPNHREAASRRQSGHPVKVLTSGKEAGLSFEEIFFTGGKWRLVRRDDWWNRYDDDAAVIVGHYWRRRDGARVDGKPDTFQTDDPYGWIGPRGNVFCIDYSVGRRFLERAMGRRLGSFDGALAALRWPERELVFDDRYGTVPTTGWGG